MEAAIKLTAIVRPHSPSASTSTSASTQRDFYRVDDFVAHVGAALGVDVVVVEGTLDDAPGDGFLLVFESAGLAEHHELCGRTILVNADRSRLPACLEELQLLAAIEKHRYFLWQTERDGENGRGLFGRREIAAVMGAEVEPVFASQHYALLGCDRYPDLAALLAGYVTACFRNVKTAAPADH